MTKPLFALNALMLTKGFIADFFLSVHVKRFQSTKARQFCLCLSLSEEELELL